MVSSRAALVAIVLLLGSATGSLAQLTGQIPGMTPQQMPPCLAAFQPLRAEAEKRAAAIKAAAPRHQAPELCQLFGRFAEAEGKVVKYMEDKAASCGIPAQVVATSKTNHAKTLETKKKICSVTAAPQADPKRNPGLGEALGMRSIPTPETTTTGSGTLDTLTGNPLAR
jgi:hypothetical protein